MNLLGLPSKVLKRKEAFIKKGGLGGNSKPEVNANFGKRIFHILGSMKLAIFIRPEECVGSPASLSASMFFPTFLELGRVEFVKDL